MVALDVKQAAVAAVKGGLVVVSGGLVGVHRALKEGRRMRQTQRGRSEPHVSVGVFFFLSTRPARQATHLPKGIVLRAADDLVVAQNEGAAAA